MSEQPDLYSSDTLHTFSIGLEGSPDLKAAQDVADMIGTVHHGFTFTVQEGLDALFDVVWHIESYEQIRASVPMYILSRKIKALGYKVCYSPLIPYYPSYATLLFLLYTRALFVQVSCSFGAVRDRLFAYVRLQAVGVSTTAAEHSVMTHLHLCQR